MNDMLSKNAMTAKQLVISQDATIDIITNSNNGNTFFVCGDIKGYVSPKACKALDDGCSIDELKYAECSNNGGATYVPCLMVKGNSDANVKRRLGAELLRN